MLIVYGAHLAVMEMDENVWTVTPLMGGPVPINPGCVRTPTWSPEDTQIAFDVQCFGNQPKNEGVHLVDFHGGPGTGEAPYVDNLVQVTTGLGIIELDWRPTWSTSP